MKILVWEAIIILNILLSPEKLQCPHQRKAILEKHFCLFLNKHKLI